MNKSKLFMIISFGVLIVSVLGSGTYALYRGVLSGNLGMNTNTHGLDYYINYVKGNDITSATLTPSSSYEGGVNSDIEFWKKDDSYDIYGKIKLTINNIGTNLSNSPALKYTVVHDGTVLSTGSLQGKASGTEITILSNLYLEDTRQFYNVYVWLDDSVEPGDISNEPLSISVDCTASLEKETYNITSYITDLYTNATKETITNNSITYNAASSVSLMNDRLGGTTTDLDGGNIRYYGASPNNYIYFNCSDYSNQTSSTCETWRIIGVFDGKVKITRNTPIGGLAWDYDKNDDGTSTTYDNNWHTSTLQKLLNEKYYNGDTAGTITYYASGSSISLNMQDVGIKNGTTRNMISNSTWNLGGYDSNSVYQNEIYNRERGTLKCSNCTYETTWTGKIALSYPSDYGYAANLSLCTQKLGSYNNSACTSNNWMHLKTIINNTYNSEQLLTPNTDSSGKNAWYHDSFGSIYPGSNPPGTSTPKQTFPTLYLNSTLEIEGGDGSSSNPYKLSV